MKLGLVAEDGKSKQPIEVQIDSLIVAGWTGRDKAAVEAHIRELEELGISRPSRTPIYYRCAASLLTTNKSIEVVGETSSGEVEFVLFSTDSGLLVGVGSDHTDREVEKIGVTISKQLCAKPVGSEVWKFDDVADHWDYLVMRSFASRDGKRELFQEGPVTAMRDPKELMMGYNGSEGLEVGAVMFCGTLPVIGPIRTADKFEIELDDPVLGRKLRHEYEVISLAIEG